MSAVMHCPISSEINLVRTLVPHEYYGAATAYAAPSMGLCLEEISFHFWPPGFLAGQNRLTHTVYYFKGLFRIVQSGHDHGMLCIHCEILPAPDNLLTLMHFPLSSRQCMYEASTVKMDGKPTGCLGLLLPGMMLICADPVSFPPVPGGDSMMNSLNNVRVGMTLDDILMGVVRVLIKLGIEALVTALTQGMKNPKLTVRELVGEPIESFFGTLAKGPAYEPLENAVERSAEERFRVFVETVATELLEGRIGNVFSDLADQAMSSEPWDPRVPMPLAPGPVPTVDVGLHREGGGVAGLDHGISSESGDALPFSERATWDQMAPRVFRRAWGEDF